MTLYTELYAAIPDLVDSLWVIKYYHMLFPELIPVFYNKDPKSFDEEYSDFKDCYNLFVKFTDMSLTGEGSLNSFTDDHNELDKEIAGKLKELDIYFD